MKKLGLILYMVVFALSAHQSAAAEDTATEMVRDAIRVALEDEGVAGKLDVDVSGYHSGFALRQRPEAYQVYVRSLSVNQQNRIWSGNIAFTAEDNKMEIFNVSGKYDELVNVPVLNQKLSQNSVINEDHVDWIEVPSRRVQFGTVMDVQDLIGQELKRSMRDRTPVKTRDLQKERIMQRNSSVNILYRNGAISLRTIGVSMDDGGVGDIISVRNASSQKVIQAVIIDGSNVEAINQQDNIKGQTAQIGGNNYVR